MSDYRVVGGDRIATRFAPCIVRLSQSAVAFGPASWRLTYRTSGSRPTATKKIAMPKGHHDFLVPVTGLEPVRRNLQGILSPWCLPFHHTGRCMDILAFFSCNVKKISGSFVAGFEIQPSKRFLRRTCGE